MTRRTTPASDAASQASIAHGSSILKVTANVTVIASRLTIAGAHIAFASCAESILTAPCTSHQPCPEHVQRFTSALPQVRTVHVITGETRERVRRQRRDVIVRFARRLRTLVAPRHSFTVALYAFAAHGASA